MVTVGYCIASFLAGALSAFVTGLLVASYRRDWIILNARKKLF